MYNLKVLFFFAYLNNKQITIIKLEIKTLQKFNFARQNLISEGLLYTILGTHLPVIFRMSVQFVLRLIQSSGI